MEALLLCCDALPCRSCCCVELPCPAVGQLTVALLRCPTVGLWPCFLACSPCVISQSGNDRKVRSVCAHSCSAQVKTERQPCCALTHQELQRLRPTPPLLPQGPVCIDPSLFVMEVRQLHIRVSLCISWKEPWPNDITGGCGMWGWRQSLDDY